MGVGTHEGHPEYEWETHEGHPEYETHEGHPELEWETHEGHPEWEWETHEGHPEFESEYEADMFFKGAFRAIKRAGRFALKRLAPLARRLAPIAARALGSMIPGVGAIAGPLAGRLVSSLVNEGEFEASNAEAAFFGANEMEAEVGHTEASHEAALTEMLAAEAAELESEAEAEALLATALPITITIMGGRRALRPVLPVLSQANGRLVRVLRRQGVAGRQLLRVVPAVQRRTVGTLRAAARAGQPITGPLAVRAMAASARRVLSNPRQLQRALVRNAVLRQRVAPPSPRRSTVYGSGRVAPFVPRRAAAYRPMRPVYARRPVYR
jgi:hypothetical protein